MPKYLLRLDDACERMDVEKWNRMEELLDKYKVKPIVGVIPHCEDPMMEKYPVDDEFWIKVHRWKEKGWTIALHGYNHVYSTRCGGINPVNQRSEFAGEPLSVQKGKISKGVAIFRAHGIEPQVFFAPSHTFDQNTLIALKEESDIRIISDTIAWDCYSEFGLTFVPQQSGRVRKLPFKTTTFCYHPNTMTEDSYDLLDVFLQKQHKSFKFFSIISTKRRRTLVDVFLNKLYMRNHTK